MTRLDEVLALNRHRKTQDELLADAEQRGYQRGVEDSRSLSILDQVDHVFLARNTIEKLWRANNQNDRARHLREVLRQMGMAIEQFNSAFRGARNYERAIIRQRLEDFKNG